jgi:hypothetical protein
MKLYKYRVVRDEVDLERLTKLLHSRAFWCARPDSLNDPEEFAWICDYAPSRDTARLLTELVVRLKGRSLGEARSRVIDVINAGRLRDLAEPVVSSMIRQCRNEIGLACFGSTADNDTLWERYAGGGAGVCVEVDASPGLTDREITNRIVGVSAGQQAVNQAARNLETAGRLIRRQRPDGKVGNYPGSVTVVGDTKLQTSAGVAGPSEDDIKRAVEAWLVQRGWRVEVKWGRAQGIDIEATRGSERWIIEAKGCGFARRDACQLLRWYAGRTPAANGRSRCEVQYCATGHDAV